MKLIASFDTEGSAINYLEGTGHIKSCEQHDFSFWKNRKDYSFLKLIYEEPFYHVYQPENLNR